MRAHRLGVNTDNLLIFSENNLSIIEAYLDNINPDLIKNFLLESNISSIFL